MFICLLLLVVVDGCGLLLLLLLWAHICIFVCVAVAVAVVPGDWRIHLRCLFVCDVVCHNQRSGQPCQQLLPLCS